MLAGLAKTAAKLAKSSRQDVVAVSMLVAAELLRVLRLLPSTVVAFGAGGWRCGWTFQDPSPWPCRAQGQVSASLWVLRRITSLTKWLSTGGLDDIRPRLPPAAGVML